MDNYRNIGRLVAVYGVQGELVLQHSLGKKGGPKGLGGLKGLKTVFLEERRDELLPWFVESIRVKGGEEVFVKLEGLDTKEKARRMLRKEVWVREQDFAELALAGKSAPVSLVGFHLFDGDVDLGEILEVIEQPHQVLCRIDLEGKEALIPLHEETLRGVDHRARVVRVELPDGLLDVYR